MNDETVTAKAALEAAAGIAPAGGLFRHKKGGLYLVIGHALHTETGEAMVIYRRVGGPDFDADAEMDIRYARPVSLWIHFTP